MKRRSAVAIAGFTGALVGLSAVASCGSRTGLLLEEKADAEPEDVVVQPDRFVAPDQFVDEPTEEDAIEEMPRIDTNRPDVPVINPCPDAAATLIYVIGESNTLYSFNPADDVFTTIGTIACPDPEAPYSMAVDREGVAYVVYESGNLYRVSTKTADCKTTAYDSAMNDHDTFGMGFVANTGDAGGETLFVAKNPGGSITVDAELATIDTSTFILTNVADFTPKVEGAELTGTGDGRLFAFSPSNTPGASFIAQIDPATANVISQDPLPGITQGAGWAFGFWGGDFYTFTAMGPDDETIVSKFDPVANTITQVATNPEAIVGAGVSTCAPQD
jgi:hypothetical protein